MKKDLYCFHRPAGHWCKFGYPHGEERNYTGVREEKTEYRTQGIPGALRRSCQGKER